MDKLPTEFAARQVFGPGDLLWAIRNRLCQRKSQGWQVVPARVEAHEFLRFSTNAGWFSVRYSYAFGKEVFSGEMRKWIIARKTSRAESDPDTIELSKLFPVGSQIQVRVDPTQPARSVAVS
jgi:hypothetical protein